MRQSKYDFDVRVVVYAIETDIVCHVNEHNITYDNVSINVSSLL